MSPAGAIQPRRGGRGAAASVAAGAAALPGDAHADDGRDGRVGLGLVEDLGVIGLGLVEDLGVVGVGLKQNKSHQNQTNQIIMCFVLI